MTLVNICFFGYLYKFRDNFPKVLDHEQGKLEETKEVFVLALKSHQSGNAVSKNTDLKDPKAGLLPLTLNHVANACNVRKLALKVYLMSM